VPHSAVPQLHWLDPLPPEQEALARQLEWLLALPPLLESAAATFECARRLCAAPPALGENRAPAGALRFEVRQGPSLYRRDRIQPNAFPIGREEKAFGVVDILWEGQGFGFYRLNLRPGGRIPLHVHRQMEEWELVITPGLVLQNQPAPLFHASQWKKEEPHLYGNATEQWQTLLCVDRPAFIPEDEIEVD
jgi:hypothetical protein